MNTWNLLRLDWRDSASFKGLTVQKIFASSVNNKMFIELSRTSGRSLIKLKIVKDLNGCPEEHLKRQDNHQKHKT